MQIAVVGTGYVGLVAGACFAETGNDVVCVDRDAAKVRSLQRGRVPVSEPGLEELVRRNRREGRLRFTTVLPRSVRDSSIVFIAVGTPRGEDGAADLRQVLAVAAAIGKAMTGYTIVVQKSTVPVGTSERVREAIAGQTSHPFAVVSNPEFLKQGAAVEDFLKPDRVVLGADDDRAVGELMALYEPFTRTGAPMMVMDCASAELAKYAANGMLATRISFMNEIANLCELVGANVDHVRRALAADARIGRSFLFPGIGFGGSCFPKDVKAVIRSAAERKYRFRVLEAVEAVNEAQKTRMLRKMRRHYPTLRGRRIAVWGLAFKPKTDDMREAPAIPLIEGLLADGASVRVFDPEAMEAARRLFGRRIGYARSTYDTLRDADGLLIATEWNEFRRPDFDRMRRLMRAPVIFDGRNVFTPALMRQHGFTYHSIGRP
jgi:UDPglucose 6-dehydrogenase